MESASSPATLARRLAALHGYRIMDTAAEAAFDDLAALAAEIVATPIGLITLLDASRQWFKAHPGLPVRETPIEQAFCAHTILGSEIMVVEDARTDARFATNPLVTGSPGIRFYAGAPLITPAGARIGSLCVIDRVPRTLAPAEATKLARLSRQVVHLLELRRLTHELALAVGEGALLRGLLPICAHCHRVRDDTGYWSRLEEYLRHHAGAEFTHGLCPPCETAALHDLDRLHPVPPPPPGPAVSGPPSPHPL